MNIAQVPHEIFHYQLMEKSFQAHTFQEDLHFQLLMFLWNLLPLLEMCQVVHSLSLYNLGLMV